MPLVCNTFLNVDRIYEYVISCVCVCVCVWMDAIPSMNTYPMNTYPMHWFNIYNNQYGTINVGNTYISYQYLTHTKKNTLLNLIFLCQ